MKRITALLFLTILSVACGSSVDTEALRDEVLDMHDEVMPKMGEVMALRKKVLVKSQELELATGSDQEEIESLKSLAVKLETANKGMMSWMNDWAKQSPSYIDQDAKPKEGVKVEDVVKFLDAEKVRVTQVRDDINASIEEAKAAIGG